MSQSQKDGVISRSGEGRKSMCEENIRKTRWNNSMSGGPHGRGRNIPKERMRSKIPQAGQRRVRKNAHVRDDGEATTNGHNAQRQPLSFVARKPEGASGRTRKEERWATPAPRSQSQWQERENIANRLGGHARVIQTEGKCRRAPLPISTPLPPHEGKSYERAQASEA